MVARLKLKGIDGRAPPGVEPAAYFDSPRGNLPGPDIERIDGLIAPGVEPTASQVQP